MEISRAVQFSPFAALRGFDTMLYEKREARIIEIRRDLPEEVLQELDWKIRQLNVSDTVRICFYNGKYYIDLEGRVSAIDVKKRNLSIDGQRIGFDNIAEIELNITGEF